MEAAKRLATAAAEAQAKEAGEQASAEERRLIGLLLRESKRLDAESDEIERNLRHQKLKVIFISAVVTWILEFVISEFLGIGPLSLPTRRIQVLGEPHGGMLRGYRLPSGERYRSSPSREYPGGKYGPGGFLGSGSGS